MEDSDESVGNYQVIRQLAVGSFGSVYLGRHNVLTNRFVAIKMMQAAPLDSLEKRESFLQEARFLEMLRHPYILPIVDVGIHKAIPYLVTEYAPNGSLRDLLKSQLQDLLPPERSLIILTQIGQALHHAHQQQIIHRDLKPENIVFNAQGDALLTDFGIATTLATASIKNIDTAGTPTYMAPEQFHGKVSKESDQYALGCIAYELFTGHPPYTAPDLFSMGFKHLTETPVPPAQLNPQLPIHIEQAILKAMAKQRTDRHPDVRTFITALHGPSIVDKYMPTIPVSEESTQTSHSPIPVPYRTEEALEQSGGQSFPIGSGKSAILDPESEKETYVPSRQQPITLLPLSQKEPITPIPLTDQEAISLSAEQAILPFQQVEDASAGHVPLPLLRSWESTHGSDVSHKGRRSTKLRWSIIAFTSLLLVASLIGILLMKSALLTPPTRNVMQGTTTSRLVTPTGIHTPAPRQRHNSSPITTPKPLVGTTGTPLPTSTRQPTPHATATPPTPTPTPTFTPTPIVPSEVVNVPLTSGASGVLTQNSYAGQITVTVCGVGQAYYVTAWSDAFYVYTDRYGNPLNPPTHKSTFPDWVLWINNQAADNFTAIPQYSTSHLYTFTMNAPGGQISFGVGDDVPTDNTGNFYVAINTSNPYC